MAKVKFRDKMTGNTLETENETVIEQFKRHDERYELVEETVKSERKQPGRAKKAAGQ